MEWTALVAVQNITPQRIWARKVVRLHRQREAIARVEHDVHGLATSRHPESYGRAAVDTVRNTRLLRTQFNLQTEAPESDATLTVQTMGFDLAILAQLLTITGLDA